MADIYIYIYMRKISKQLLFILSFTLLSLDCIEAQVHDTVRTMRDSTVFSARKRRLVTENEKRNFRTLALGVDRDTLQYIIASPFDNWFFGAGAGIQEYHGNELVKSARWNPLAPNVSLEVGKWIIPDLSVSLFVQGYQMNSQAKYHLNPYIDWSTDTTADGYYRIHAPAIGVGGLVTLDWTNFLRGYERGRARRFHFDTPIGLGYMVNFGERKNFRRSSEQPFNQELYATLGIQLNYRIANHIILTGNARTSITRQSFDYTPYDNTYSNIDMMLAVNLGIRIDLFKEVYLTNRDGTYLQEINHHFIPIPSEKVYQDMQDKLRELLDNYEQQKKQMGQDSALMAKLRHEIDSLSNLMNETEGADIVHQLYTLIQSKNRRSAVVYFQLDRFDLDLNALKILDRFAEQINKMPEDSVFYIIGGADSATGSPQHNWWLSNRRCESIYRALTKYFGVNPRQLQLYPLGGISEYHPYELNRIGIVTLKTEDVTGVMESLKSHSEERPPNLIEP